MCQVRCFENIIEMNFAFSEAEGVAIAIEADMFRESHSLLGRIRRVAQGEQPENL